MNRFLSTLVLCVSVITSTIGAEYCCLRQDCNFYIKMGSGISFSNSANVFAPSDVWVTSLQGYDSKLGNSPIAFFGIGCEFMNFLDLEVSISNRSTFKYRKFQTSFEIDESFTREFDLSVTPLLFSLQFLGRDFSCLNWGIGCSKIYPIVGVGVGLSNLLITNFRTTLLAPTGASDPFLSFSAENQYTLRRNFTYSALVGMEYNYNDCWAISTGYRWLDAGQFKGPRFLRLNSGASVDIDGGEWKIKFRSNEWFLEFKIFL